MCEAVSQTAQDAVRARGGDPRGFKYRDFTDRQWGREFREFHGWSWTHAEGPVALFNHAVTWLRKNRVLLGVSVLTRQVRGLYAGRAAPVRGGGPCRAPGPIPRSRQRWPGC